MPNVVVVRRFHCITVANGQVALCNTPEATYNIVGRRIIHTTCDGHKMVSDSYKLDSSSPKETTSLSPHQHTLYKDHIINTHSINSSLAKSKA